MAASIGTTDAGVTYGFEVSKSLTSLAGARSAVGGSSIHR
jgi:hypothetical protein